MHISTGYIIRKCASVQLNIHLITKNWKGRKVNFLKLDDYGLCQKECPTYDFDNCNNPDIPPTCPIIEVTNR